MIEYLIIGAGITGITLCKKLRECGVDDVLVLEKLDEPGGLCRSKMIDGHVVDIGGGHFFGTKIPEIKEYVFSLLSEQEFNYHKRVSKIEIGNETIDYPLESNIWQLPIEKQIDYLISVIRNGEASNTSEPSNYEEWIRWKLGDRICDDYMIPYNSKLWGVAPNEMDIDWLYKIPRVDVKEVLEYCLKREQDVSKFPAHIYFYYPKTRGFQSIVDAIVKDENKYIRYNEKVNKLRFDNDRWIINDCYEARNVINTTPWNDLFIVLGSPDELRSEFEKIKYNRIVITLFEKDYDHNWHWRYIPDRNKMYHREFYIGNYAEDSKCNGIYTETNIKRYSEDIQYSGAGRPLYSAATDAAYPIPVIGHTAAINNIRKYYENKRLYGVGRWGQHQYQNADVSMHEAIKFVNSIVR